MTSAASDSGQVRPVESVDLSRMRHELRTPINHILGYCEMLLEEAQCSPAVVEDLRRIHTGGRELQALIGRYFDEEGFFQERNLHNLYHELRTPVNHIIGYSDLLIEQAPELGLQAAVADLLKIREAASNWLALMEAYLIEPGVNQSSAPSAAGTSAGLALNLGFSFKVPEPKSAKAVFKDEGAILVVDDDESSREMLARRLRRSGYTVSAVSTGLNGLSLARSQKFDLVMLDMIMPGLDGFQVLAKLKADAALREIPVIMLSALDEENGIARCIELGAEDYLAKPFNPVFLRARIGACLEKKRLRDKERTAHEALHRSEQHLAAELTRAAQYVRSLLPQPLTGTIATEWCFQPSEHLGGDAFGYHWIDPDHFALYLLDVSGHGVGAALLSVSVLNALRAQTLPGVDFRRPEEVLGGLNRAFRMENQNFFYFTAWYGVYCPGTRQLSFSCAGHPPALLIHAKSDEAPVLEVLSTKGPAVGCFEDARFPTVTQAIPEGARLLVLSDGVFEIFKPGEAVGTWEEFLNDLQRPEILSLPPQGHLQRAQTTRGSTSLEDDFSLIEVRFG